MNKNKVLDELVSLKTKSGNHSPSLKEIEDLIGSDSIKIDACFLSNPYATALVYEYNFLDKINANFIKLVESYPPNQPYLLKKLSKIEKINPENSLVLNGAQNCIEILMSKINYKNCLLPIPTYSAYYESLKKDAKIHYFNLLEEENFYINRDKLYRTINENKIDLLVLINPNNPTGIQVDQELIVNLIKDFPDLQIIIDESFIHFIKHWEKWTKFRKKLIDNKNIFFVKSMSKDFGISGLRIGYLETKNELITEIKNKYGTWSLNNFAVEFLNIISTDNFIKDYANVRKKYLNHKKDFFYKLKKIKSINVFHSDSNFFLIKVNKNIKNGFKSAMEILVNDGLYIRSMEDKIGLNSSFFRVGCRTKEENDKIYNILNDRFG